MNALACGILMNFVSDNNNVLKNRKGRIRKKEGRRSIGPKQKGLIIVCCAIAKGLGEVINAFDVRQWH